MRKPKLGDRVSTREPVEAYYSNYGGQPFCEFTPGEVGIVAAVDVPPIRGARMFYCVDFEKYGKQWRVALRSYQIEWPAKAPIQLS